MPEVGRESSSSVTVLDIDSQDTMPDTGAHAAGQTRETEVANNNIRKPMSQQRSHQSTNGSTPGRNDEEMQLEQTTDVEKGFEVGWDGGEDDPENPRSMSFRRKWVIVMSLAATSICVTVNSSIYTFTYDQIMPLFGISKEVATLGLSIFVIGLMLGPLFLAPLSEFYGRRWIYIGALFMVLIWTIPCAVAQNAATLLVARFFVGLGGTVFLSVAGGTIGDMFNKSQLSFPMMVYSGSPFIGPALGPVLGGFINQYADWRWTFYVLLIWTGVMLVIVFFFVPETYHPVKLRMKAKRLRKETGDSRIKAPIEMLDKSILKTVLWSCIRPFQLLFLEPMVLNLCILSAILLGILYLFFGALPLVFMTNHGFDLSQTGLSFIGMLIGMLIAIVSNPIWKWNYNRLIRNREAATGEMGGSEPEYRLPPTIIGVQFCWVGMMGFAWTQYSFIHWAVPMFFTGLFGFGTITTYTGIFTFLVESYPLYAASALAANSFARSSFAAGFPLFGDQMYSNLGYQWASFLLACLCLMMAPFPYLFFVYGKRIRGQSRFATNT